MPHFKEAWCSGVDFLYSIDYEGMLDQGEIGADRDVLSLGADELRLLPADTAPVGVGAVPGALFGRKTGEPLPSAVSSARVLKLVGGAEGDPLTWLPLDGFKDESWREGSHAWSIRIVELQRVLAPLTGCRGAQARSSLRRRQRKARRSRDAGFGSSPRQGAGWTS